MPQGVIYRCTNCSIGHLSVGSWLAHRGECKRKYSRKPRYELIQPAAVPTLGKEESETGKYCTPPQHLAVYGALVHAHGEKCFICGYLPPPVAKPHEKLQIDHMNKNIQDWHFDNCHLTCQKCNLDLRELTVSGKRAYFARIEAERSGKDSDRGEGEGGGEIQSKRSYVSERMVDSSGGSVEIQLSEIYKDRLKEWLNAYLVKNNSIEWNDAAYSGANVAGCSPKTAKEYLRMFTSITGSFQAKQNSRNQIIVTKK